MLNWSEFFSRAGEGLADYGSYLYGRSQDEKDRKREAALLALQQASAARDEERLGLDRERVRQDAIRDSRDSLREGAQHRSDQLFKTGIMVPESFNQDAMQARLPEASQAIPDSGSMVINALRSAGQEGVDEVYEQGPEALNKLYAGKGLSQPMEGGGYAFLEPSVRATLEAAASSRASADANRKSAWELAKYRIDSRPKDDPKNDRMELKRLEFVTKRAEELIKPTMDKYGFKATGPGLPPTKAYEQAQREWKVLVEGPTPEAMSLPDSTGGSAALAEPGLGAFGSATYDFDPDAVRAEITGMDADSARQVLESAGYSEEEIDEVLGVN